MHILIAPQALKGSLSAAETARAIAQGARAAAPDVQVTELPIADGGEGTVEAMVAATAGKIIPVTVTGPLGEPVDAFFGILGGSLQGTAIIEMAAASGLPLVPREHRDPRITTTWGTGELIRHALDLGCRRLLIGIGGSATHDGGAGMVQALGVHLLDEQGQELPAGGTPLARLARIMSETLDPRLRETVIQVACDVDNPLCGPHGASAIYGPQKGATPAMVRELDDALHHYATIIKRDLGVDVLDLPGAGAAGGLGAGLVAFLKAELLPGAQMVLSALHLKHVLPMLCCVRVWTAQKRIQLKDCDRIRYLQAKYRRHPEDSHLYDIVVNTATLELESAVNLIMQALEYKARTLLVLTEQLGPAAGLARYPGRPGDFRPPEHLTGAQ